MNHTELRCDRQFNYIELGNILMNQGEDDPFLVAILVCDKLTQCESVNAYFTSSASVTDPRPAFMAFVSRDESIAGRCMSVQVMTGGHVVVTIVHAHLKLSDIGDLIVDLETTLIRHDNRFQHMGQMTASVCPKVLLDAIKDSATIVAHQAQRYLDRTVEKMDGREADRSQQDVTMFGEGPDLPTLLASAPGPIVEITKSLGAIRSAVTIMMGTVAVICIESDGYRGMGPATFVHSIPGVQVAFFVIQHKYDMPEEVVYVLPGLYGDNGVELPTILDVDVFGVPMIHIAHIIEAAAKAAFTHRRKFLTDRLSVKRLNQVIESACDRDMFDDIEARRTRRASAEDVIARTLDQNLERIKARLWRPEGRLARAMISQW
jgi:hypothetical protein